MKKILIIIFYLYFLLCFINCTEKIYEEFEQPVSEILSIEKISESDYQVKLHINRGVGPILKEIYLIFDDMTDLNMSFTQKLQFENEDKEFEFNTNVKLADKHDYKIQSVLQSEKNEYKGDVMYFYLSEKYQYPDNLIDMEFPDLEFLKDIPNNIGYISNLNGWVNIYFYYKQLPDKPRSVTVNIDGKILFNGYLSFDFWIYDNLHQMYFVDIGIILKDISVGDHLVHVTLDGKEYVMREKIRILEGNVTYSNFVSAPQNWMTNYPNWNMPFFFSDKLFYFYFDYSVNTNDIFYEIISFDLKNNNWNQHGSINFSKERCNFCVSNIQIGENLYAITMRDSIRYLEGDVGPYDVKVLEIWKYNFNDNSFTKETKYPGEAFYEPLFFTDNENIYMGGGYTYNNTVEEKVDFWCYNLNTEKWSKKNNTPISLKSSCLLVDNTIYIFTCYRDLWKYSPVFDSWQKISTLKGGSYYRESTSFLHLNGDLYVVGGTSINDANIYYEDVWKYNIEADSWTLKTFYNLGYYKYPAFIFNNKIYSTDHNISNTYKFAVIQ